MTTFPSQAVVTYVTSTPNTDKSHCIETWLVYLLLRLSVSTTESSVTLQLTATHPSHKVLLRDGKGGFHNPLFTGATSLEALNHLLAYIHQYGGCVQYYRKTREIRNAPPLQLAFDLNLSE